MKKWLAVILLVTTAMIGGCSSAPEATDVEVTEITFRPGWRIYRIIDLRTGKVVYVSPNAMYSVTMAEEKK